jgi:hypothetical protein
VPTKSIVQIPLQALTSFSVFPRLLEEIQAGKPGNGIPYIYYAVGYFPNAVPGTGVDFISVVGDAIIAVLAANHAEGRNVIVIAAESDYPILNSTQCEATLAPTLFGVGVDVANKLIQRPPNHNSNNGSNSGPLVRPDHRPRQHPHRPAQLPRRDQHPALHLHCR